MGGCGGRKVGGREGMKELISYKQLIHVRSLA